MPQNPAVNNESAHDMLLLLQLQHTMTDNFKIEVISQHMASSDNTLLMLYIEHRPILQRKIVGNKT